MRRRDVLRMTGRGLSAVGAAGTGAAHSTTTPDAPPETVPEPSDGSGFAPLASIRIDGAKEAVVGPDDHVYLAATDGFAVVDAGDPAAPEVVAERRGLLPEREGGPLRLIQDVKVRGDRLLVVGPAHPRGPDALSAALLYDVSDPTSPEQVAVHETGFPIHNSFFDGDYAYLTASDGDRNPLVILDADGLAEVGRWSLLDRDPGWGEVDPRLRPLHDLWVHDGLAYLAYWDAGTWIVDATDPADPGYVGRVGGRPRAELAAIEDGIGGHVTALPGNHHSAVVDEAGDVLAVGEEAWSTDPEKAPGGIDLWDVSTPAEPRRLSRIAPPATPDPSRAGTWTTAHNFDLRGGRLYSSWYQGGVKVHDVGDPREPERLAWWHDPETARFWTAQRAAGSVVASSLGVGDVPPGLFTFPVPEDTTPTPSPTASTETPTAEAETATPGNPGFGVLAALAGVVLAARRYRRE